MASLSSSPLRIAASARPSRPMATHMLRASETMRHAVGAIGAPASPSSGRGGARLNIKSASTTSTLAWLPIASAMHSSTMARTARWSLMRAGTWCSAATSTNPCPGSGVDTAVNGGMGRRRAARALKPCQTRSASAGLRRPRPTGSGKARVHATLHSVSSCPSSWRAERRSGPAKRTWASSPLPAEGAGAAPAPEPEPETRASSSASARSVRSSRRSVSARRIRTSSVSAWAADVVGGPVDRPDAAAGTEKGVPSKAPASAASEHTLPRRRHSPHPSEVTSSHRVLEATQAAHARKILGRLRGDGERERRDIAVWWARGDSRDPDSGGAREFRGHVTSPPYAILRSVQTVQWPT